MADMVTGLGQTLKEAKVQGGAVTVADALRAASERMRGAVKEKHEFGELNVVGSCLSANGELLCRIDDHSWGIMAKLLGIPTPYLMRLGSKMRALNVNYWLQSYHDKEVVTVIKDEELLEMKDGVEVDKCDVLETLNRIVPGGTIIRASNPTNAVMWDVIDERRWYDSRAGKWVGGMRLVVKDGLNAPEISPLFVNAESCGSIECSEYFERLNIKSLGYGDIIHVIGERMADCSNCLDSLFSSYQRIEGEFVPNAKRRISLYCREHNVPDRVRKYATSVYDDAPNTRGDFGNIISVFSTLGFSDEVKPSSERKLQKLAGHIVTKAHSEDRCDKCDALSVE